jgi:dipeptidase E
MITSQRPPRIVIQTPKTILERPCWKPPAGGDKALGLVDFSMFPHLGHENMPENSMAGAEKWSASVPVPGYAIDDQTAIKVTNGTVEVISEGHWKLFAS